MNTRTWRDDETLYYCPRCNTHRDDGFHTEAIRDQWRQSIDGFSWIIWGSGKRYSCRCGYSGTTSNIRGSKDTYNILKGDRAPDGVEHRYSIYTEFNIQIYEKQ